MKIVSFLVVTLSLAAFAQTQTPIRLLTEGRGRFLWKGFDSVVPISSTSTDVDIKPPHKKSKKVSKKKMLNNYIEDLLKQKTIDYGSWSQKQYGLDEIYPPIELQNSKYDFTQCDHVDNSDTNLPKIMGDFLRDDGCGESFLRAIDAFIYREMDGSGKSLESIFKKYEETYPGKHITIQFSYQNALDRWNPFLKISFLIEENGTTIEEHNLFEDETFFKKEGCFSQPEIDEIELKIRSFFTKKC